MSASCSPQFSLANAIAAALSDEEVSGSSGDEQIPAKRGRKSKTADPEPEEDAEEEAEGEDEEDECARQNVHTYLALTTAQVRRRKNHYSQKREGEDTVLC